LSYSVKVNAPRGVKPITRAGIMKFINNLWADLGLHQCHGFRKFFETNAFKAAMDHIYIRRLMGQKAGLEDSYLKIPEDLLEGDNKHVGYIGIMDQLTIDESQRLRRQVQTLKIEKSKMDMLEQKVDKLNEVFQKFIT
jgi:hypothetical protein